MDTATPDYQQLLQLWLEMGSRIATATASAFGEPHPGDAAKVMRDAYLQALAQQTESFTRSPQFLEMMKQSTEAAVTFRQQTNDLLEKIHHAGGGLARSDMDSLLMAVRRCETRILDRLDEIAQKIDALESRTAATPSNGKPSRTAK
jgi:hypothetical protein